MNHKNKFSSSKIFLDLEKLPRSRRNFQPTRKIFSSPKHSGTGTVPFLLFFLWAISAPLPGFLFWTHCVTYYNRIQIYTTNTCHSHLRQSSSTFLCSTDVAVCTPCSWNLDTYSLSIRGSTEHLFQCCGSGVKKFPDLGYGSASKNKGIFNPRLFLKSRKNNLRCLSWIPDPRIPDPGVKKVPDPGSVSATQTCLLLLWIAEDFFTGQVTFRSELVEIDILWFFSVVDTMILFRSWIPLFKSFRTRIRPKRMQILKKFSLKELSER